MIGENSNLTYDSSFFQCYICMLNVKKPRMCPSCSKLACENCLRKWIQDSKSECPHCRKVLPLNGFADCQRFVNDIKHLINSMDSTQKSKEKCKQHNLQMQYFCEQCTEAICSDCGMFGVKHKGHKITHLSKIYQENKNKILNQLARFDQKIESYRKNGFFIKLQMQKLMIQIGQKKTFIEEYFVALVQRLQDEFKDKKSKLQNQFEENSHQIQLLQAFRDQISHQLERNTEKQIISNSEQLVNEIHKLCQKDKNKEFEEQEYTFQTIQQIVPKYDAFKYTMQKYLLSHEGITYSEPYSINGIEWRLKIYPRGNGVAKDTHISVFLEMSKAYSNQNKYEYKIQLVNHFNPKDSIIRQYSSKFDIGQCWGYNQFIPLGQLQNGFMDSNGGLNFCISVRNPTYKSLVRDQQNYIKVLENKLKSNEESPLNPKSRERISKLSKQSENHRIQLKKTLLNGQNQIGGIMEGEQQCIRNGGNGLCDSKNRQNQSASQMQINDHLAMLEADSIQDEYRNDANNLSRMSLP